MELSKKSLDDLISAADKIIEANSSPENDLFEIGRASCRERV